MFVSWITISTLLGYEITLCHPTTNTTTCYWVIALGLLLCNLKSWPLTFSPQVLVMSPRIMCWLYEFIWRFVLYLRKYSVINLSFLPSLQANATGVTMVISLCPTSWGGISCYKVDITAQYWFCLYTLCDFVTLTFWPWSHVTSCTFVIN